MRRAVAIAVTCLGAVAGCGGTPASPAAQVEHGGGGTGSPPSATATGTPAGGPMHPSQAVVAEAVGATVHVYPSPRRTRPVLTLPNPWLLNGATTHPVPQWFLVATTRPDGWVQIRLPVRPNGTTGWLAPGTSRLLVDPYRVTVSLRQHRIVVWNGDSRVYAGAVAVGAPSTPTPSGLFYLRVLLRNGNERSVYGPFAYGLSAHSEALTTFDGGDAEIGIHGNNDAGALGHSVTHGCVRMDNAAITRLTALLPLGTPVTITA